MGNGKLNQIMWILIKFGHFLIVELVVGISGGVTAILVFVGIIASALCSE